MKKVKRDIKHKKKEKNKKPKKKTKVQTKSKEMGSPDWIAQETHMIN